MEEKTERLSLVKVGETVLIGDKYQWSAFKITEQSIDYTFGVWLLDGCEDRLNRGLPTKSLTDSWIKSEIVRLNKVISDKESLLQKLYKLESGEKV